MNVAMDVIREMLSVWEHAPEGGVTLPNMQERWPQIKSGMTCLEIYSIIRQNELQLPDQPEENESMSRSRKQKLQDKKVRRRRRARRGR